MEVSLNPKKVLLRVKNEWRNKNGLTVKTPIEFKRMLLFQNVNIKRDTMEMALLLLQAPDEH